MKGDEGLCVLQAGSPGAFSRKRNISFCLGHSYSKHHKTNDNQINTANKLNQGQLKVKAIF